MPLKFACDASQYGVGTVISNLLPSGDEKPSRKRGVGHNFWNQKIHQYIYGRKFQLVTDHKPLTTISSLKTGLSTLAAARLQHWAIMLSDYQYDIEFWSTHKHGNADCLSRLPLKVPAGTE